MDDTPCGCKQKCFEKVGDDHRKKLFDNFWKLSNFDIQNAYLVGCVEITEVHRRYSPQGETSRRKYSREYTVRSDTMCSIPVCKTAFLRIHGVSNGRLSRALKAVQREAHLTVISEANTRLQTKHLMMWLNLSRTTLNLSPNTRATIPGMTTLTGNIFHHN